MTEQNIRVLLVEDDDIDREAIERHIEEMQLPYILQTAASRGEALERLRTSAYDVVLLDYMLADGTGLELLPHVEETPSIIITGRGSEQVAVEAVQRGAYDYLIKDPERNYLTVLPLTIRNVLTRKHAEKALREKDTRYRLLIEASASGISLLDKDGNFLFVNEPTAKIWGKRPEDVINKNLKDVVPPEFADEALNIIRKMSETETGLEQERCIEPLHKHFIENIQPIFDAKKKFLGVQVITFDITDRKRTEEALRESNQKLQANLTYLESMTTISKISGQHFELEDMIAKIIEAVFEIFDPDRAWLQFPGDPNSPTFRVHYEYARQEYPGAKIEGIDVPMDDGTKGIIRDLLSTDEPVTYDLSNSMFKKTGAVKHFSVQSQMSIILKPIIGKPWVLGMHQCSYERTWTEDERALFKDISLRMTDSFSSLLMNRNLRTSERELRKSEEKFRAISDYTYDWESWHGIDGQLLWVNRAVERFTGYSIEECMAMSDYPLPLIHKDDRDNIEKAFRQAVEEKTSVNDLPFRIRRKDVAILWAAVSWQPIYDTTGNHMGLRSSVRDITERKKADERVQESEEKYRSLIGNIPGAAYRCRCDEHWTMEFISDEIEKMTSYPATDFIEHAVRSFFSIIHREDQQRAVDVVTKSVENKESFAIEYRLVTADGNIRWVFEKGQCVVNEQGKATYLDGFILDITGRKQAEKALAEYREHLEAIVAERTRELRASQEKLIHAERLAVMGKFASGIAHEIRNPLGVIDSSVYYLKLLLQDADEETRQQLDRIKLNVTKCTTIIQNLQNLTKMKAPQKVRLDIAAAIADGLAGAQVPQDVKIVQQVAAGELWVDADREQLVMVFKNIVTNAIQAMQYAGTLWVTAGRTGDGEIEVTFEDSGPGIAPEHLEQLFQPFFSTKEKGFGVGLPICKMIIEKHGGTLEAQSEAGQGATFSVRLPIAETKNNRG